MNKKFTKLMAALALLTMITLPGKVWADDVTVTLTSGQIKAGTGSASYGACSATDGGGNTWRAYAIKNQHSNATSDYHFWQIKKYASNTAYYIQVPELGTQITSITMTVSGSSQPMTGGGNTATLYFSNSNSTSSTGTGVVSGTGTSSVTIDCSSLNLNTGYITASGAVRVWEVSVTYTTGGGSTVATPTFDPAEGTYTSAQNVTISCTTQGASIYYTTDGSTPDNNSTEYTAAIPVSTTTTIKAIAYVGNDASTVASTTYTILTPLTTMQAIYDANSTSTDQTVAITFDNWIITGISSSYAFLSDGDKGLLIFGSGHGFVQGDILSGTVVCKLNRYIGMARLTQLTSTTAGIHVENGANPTPTITTINTMEGVNTGKLITLNGLTCHVEGTTYTFTDGENHTVYPYSWGGLTSFRDYLSDGKTYDVTGVFCFGNSTNEKRINPRSVSEIMPTPADLPFHWTGGGKSALMAFQGVTANGLGSDYAESNFPYLVKFDNTDDYILVRTDSQPDVVTIGVKMLGGSSTSKITVQASTDGVNFDAGQELTISGSSSAELELTTTRSFDADVRYVKMLFTKGSNVGVGPISITSTEPYITIESDAFELTANEEEGYLEIEYGNFDPISFDIMYCNANGEELSEAPDWFMLAIEAPQGETGDFVYYVADANDGEARTAYFKVYASLGEGQETVYSNLVTVTQAAPVVDYATLPFNWEGGTSAALDNENGVTVNSDEDYAAQNAPYRVKFSASTHYILVKTNDQPAVVSVGIKKFSNGNGSTLNIEGSSDGQNFTTVQSFTVSGSQNDELTFITTNAFNANYRYVKISFNKPSSGGSNIGVGPITISGLESYTLTINAHTTNGGWYLIASPVAVNPADVTGMTDGNFDLYRFNGNPTPVDNVSKEWENWKQTGDHFHFDLEPGKGYLYAHATDVDLIFSGTMATSFTDVVLPYDEASEVKSLYLAGNSLQQATTFFVYDGDLEKQLVNFLTLNGTGDGFVTTQTNAFIAQAMQGFFVQSNGEQRLLSIDDVDAKGRNAELLNVMVSQNRGTLVDNAIVSFGNAPLMSKFYLTDNSTRIFIPQNGEEMAVVRSEAQGEMPVNFKAKENGTYTLSIDAEGVDMNYLHLIDNMTGNDIDLLQTPSYTFNAKVNDYESRFRLVFSANNEDASTGSTAFAFFSNGNLIVNNEGNATLQVIDINGRILSSETISGSCSKAINATTGVYMLRLINGDNVKVQKVVVR